MAELQCLSHIPHRDMWVPGMPTHDQKHEMLLRRDAMPPRLLLGDAQEAAHSSAKRRLVAEVPIGERRLLSL